MFRIWEAKRRHRDALGQGTFDWDKPSFPSEEEAYRATPRALFGHDNKSAEQAGWRFERAEKGYNGNQPASYAISPEGFRYTWNGNMMHGGADPWELDYNSYYIAKRKYVGEDSILQMAKDAIAKHDMSNTKGMKSAQEEIVKIARDFGMFPNELWKDVVYEPEGMSKDIEAKPEKQFVSKRPTSQDAFIDNMVKDLQQQYGKNALTQAKQQRDKLLKSGRNKGMIQHLDNVIEILSRSQI